MRYSTLRLFLFCLCALGVSAVNLSADEPKWVVESKAKSPMTVDEAKAFMKRLATFAIENHMKKDSAQRGMMYEYWEPGKKGQFDQYVQGEALDTMHDGAWFAVAMSSAYRATGDAYYKSILTDWQMPFYCKMLNHSDTLFNRSRNDARPDRQKTWADAKEWLLQEGEKGFVPYWWDDGGSVSLERVQTKNDRPEFPCFDDFAAKGEANPKALLSGYSLGSSSHMAQDLGVMLQGAWVVLKDDPKWAAELTEAAKNLQQCRTNHGHAGIPAVVAPLALMTKDAKLMGRAIDPNVAKFFDPENHYTKAMVGYAAGQKYAIPGFADDQEYQFYSGSARGGGEMGKALAFKLIYDAYTHPLMFGYYCDDWDVPAGIGKFDLYQMNFVNGKPEDYRTDRKGPEKGPKPLGSRFGPQNMAVSGWALQALRAFPGIWEERYKTRFAKDARVFINGEGATVEIGGGVIGIRSTHQRLELAGESPGDEVTLRINAQADRKGNRVELKMSPKDLKVVSTNQEGKGVLFKGTVEKGDKGVRFEIAIPYTVMKGQEQWGNVIEHGRMSIVVGREVRNLYFASSEATVVAALERELGQGLRTWEAVFNEFGYVPTGMGEARWQKFSDTGGYAHLIQAAAQWVNYKEGKRDWEGVGR